MSEGLKKTLSLNPLNSKILLCLTPDNYFYLSKGDPLEVKGLTNISTTFTNLI